MDHEEKKAKRKAYEVHVDAIRQILLHDWDPIGVGDDPDARDEYDFYIPRLYRLMVLGASRQAVARYLRNVERLEMGLLNDDERIVADRLERSANKLIQLAEKMERDSANR